MDAATLYCQRTRSGQLCALQQLDGATIKRVIDDWGRTPQPYSDADGAIVYPPAYQQVLKGLPAVNYSARDIIYRPRNVRAHPLPNPPPQAGEGRVGALAGAAGADDRQHRAAPSALAARLLLRGLSPGRPDGVPNSWTLDQIKQFQDYWDTEFAGDLAKRRRAKFVPGDTAGRVRDR